VGFSLFRLWYLSTSVTVSENVPRSFFILCVEGQTKATIGTLIPQFPDFKLLEYNDRRDVEDLIQKLPAYSDFNFTSLHIWNVRNEMQISRFNENLVVRFSDYITGDPFISFFGIQDVAHIAMTLIAYSEHNHGLSSLKLIPETVAILLPQSDFNIGPDRDAFDYIYPISFFKSLAEQPAKCKPATMLRAFIKSYPHYTTTTLPLIDTNTDELRLIFKKWACSRGVNYRSLHEFIAFECGRRSQTLKTIEIIFQLTRN